MGKLRTINHPGIEIQEVDMSGSAEQVGGCTTLVMGFFPQGESGKPVQPTTNTSVKSYFGTPETEAERYAYYACKTVFDNGGNLVAARIPYNNNSQYLTPAVKYNIEEWSTKHIREYAADSNAKKINCIKTANYGETEIGDTDKQNFYYGNGTGIYTQTIYLSSEYGGDMVTTEVDAISAAGVNVGMNEYYELVYRPFAVTSNGVTVAVSNFVPNPDIADAMTFDSWNDMFEHDGNVDEYAKLTVAVSFGKESGKYLDGDFAADSYYRHVEANGEGEERYSVSSIGELSEKTSWASGLDYYPIVSVSSSEYEMPRYTANSVSDFPELPESINVTFTEEDVGESWPSHDIYTYDEVADSYSKVDKSGTPDPDTMYYRVSFRIEDMDDLTETTTFKSIAASADYPAYGNYFVSVASAHYDEDDDRYVGNPTYAYTGNVDGYYVYDIGATEVDGSLVPVEKWRRFWDYTFMPGMQWMHENPNKYNEFTFSMEDVEGQYSDSNVRFTVNSPEWIGSDGVIVVADMKTGRLSFSGSQRGDFTIMPILQDRRIYPGMDCSFLTEDNSSYFDIIKHTLDGFDTSVKVETGSYFYTETVCSENKSDFFFDQTFSSPVTALVDYYGEYGLKKATAIKSFYESGAGTQYPEISPTDYLELRVWDADEIESLSDLNAKNAQHFDIVRRKYVGTLKSDVTKVNGKYFKSVPVTSDVTNGYVGDDGITSEALALTGSGDFVESNYPQVADMNPFGTGWMKVLTKTKGDQPFDFDINNFYQLVSPYSRIQDIVENHSEKYQWIHWRTSSTEETTTKPGILLSKMLGCEIEDVPVQLSDVENIVAVVPDQDYLGFMPLNEYQDYRDEAKIPTANTIVVANITEQKFGSDTYNNAVASDSESDTDDYSEEVLGIVPVLMGGFQALPRQSRVELPDGITNGRIFDALQSIVRGRSIDNDPAPAADHVDIKAVTLNPEGYVRRLGTKDEYDAYESTYSNQLLSAVPAIDLNANYKPNGSKMNYVTLAVCQLSLSKVNDNKIAMTVLETFTGSLDKGAKGEDDKSLFIDDVVNNEDTGSTYVRLFSNYQTTLTGSQTITESMRDTVAPASNDTKVTLFAPASLGSALWWTKDKPSMSLGFTNEQTKKYISYATIVATMENVFDSLSNVDEIDIDVVVDAGISTIANRVKKYCDAHPEETKMLYDVFFDEIKSVEDVAGWKSMCSKLTTFCQTTRKDCIALLDAPRSLCVKDNVKLISAFKRREKNEKYSIDYDILPKFNYLGGMNSSYAAGYCDWLLAVDDFSSKNMWLPPSISAEGAVIFTDYNSNYWMAPAGQSRGNVMWAVDVAFNPNAQQQDSIYSKGWNYAISSSGSIMVWGQKTMLNSTSSFNRINIRRLFCRLERMTRKNSKWVIFELNNERTRNIYKDRIDPIFANVKAMGGIYDYQIICDTRNNTPNVVQNNEFRSAFLIKPEHVAEYITLTFFNMNQDMDFSEAYSQL